MAKQQTIRPGYKQTEVGMIPDEWEMPKVGDVCGCIVPGRNKPKSFDGDIPWITTPDLEDGKTVGRSRLGLCISRDEAKAVGSKVVPPDSVLMSCAGELGIVALTQNEIVVNQQLHVFIPTERIDGTFLLYALAQRKEHIASLATKTAVPYLNKNNCNSILIPLPPLPEQRVIASALSDVEDLIASLDMLIAKKRDLKQAAMQQLLTGAKRLPGFDEEWRIEDFSRILKKIGTKLNQIQTHDYAGHGSYPVVDQGQSIIAAYTDKDSKLFKCPLEGVIVFGDHTRIIKFIDFNFVVGADGTQVLEVQSGCSAKFMYYQLLQKEIPSTGYNRHFKFLKDMRFFKPSYEEQTAIATDLSDMDAEIAALEQRRDKTRALKQGMMQELLTGKTRLI